MHVFTHFYFAIKDPGNEVVVQIPEERVYMTSSAQMRNGKKKGKPSDKPQKNSSCSSNGKMKQKEKSSQNEQGKMSESMKPESMKEPNKPMQEPNKPMKGSNKPMKCGSVNIDESKSIALTQGNLDIVF